MSASRTILGVQPSVVSESLSRTQRAREREYVTVPPTVNALLALDRQAKEAYFRGDAAFFDGVLSDRFARRGPGGTSVSVRDGDAWKLAFT